MRLASENDLAPALARFDDLRDRLTGYNADMLDDPTAGPSLRSYVILTDDADLVDRLGLTKEELFWSRYFWLRRFQRIWTEHHAFDAGLQQQVFELLEQSPQDFDATLVEVDDAVEWDPCRLRCPALADQVEQLVALGYPASLGLEPRKFRAHFATHTERCAAIAAESPAPAEGMLPFVVVVRAAHRSDALTRVVRSNKPAVEKLTPKGIDDFQPIEELELPDGDAYLLVGIERGADSLDVTPNDARRAFARAAGFSMLGSRCGDKRVPAFWLSEGRPKLGWCWAGNPHTWLGSASCAERVLAMTVRETKRDEEESWLT